MSLSFYVINGKIPAIKLKALLATGRMVGVSQVRDKRRNIVMIKYDKTGYWEGYIDKGNVVEFTEYAGGHGKDKAQNGLIIQLERLFKCKITTNIDELNDYTIKTTGKPLEKDPHANCMEVIFNKEYPEGRCMKRFPSTGLPKDFWL